MWNQLSVAVLDHRETPARRNRFKGLIRAETCEGLAEQQETFAPRTPGSRGLLGIGCFIQSFLSDVLDRPWARRVLKDGARKVKCKNLGPVPQRDHCLTL